MMQLKTNTLIGIDPGIETGVTVYTRKPRLIVEMKTFGFWETFDYVLDWPVSDVTLFIENPMLNRFSYARHTQVGADALKIARNAGGNCREAELMIQGFKRRGYEVCEVKPTERKWTAVQFKAITGHTGPTNQHVRDACGLVYGL